MGKVTIEGGTSTPAAAISPGMTDEATMRRLQGTWRPDQIEKGEIATTFDYEGFKRVAVQKDQKAGTVLLYRLLPAKTFNDEFPLDAPERWPQGKGARERIGFLKARPLGTYHGILVRSAKREWVVTGAPVLVQSVPNTTKATPPGAKAAPKTPKPVSNPGVRPADLSNIDGIPQGVAEEILAAIQDDVLENLQSRGRELIEAYLEAAKEHVSDGDEDSKKFRYTFSMSGSIQQQPTGGYLVETGLAFTVKRKTDAAREVGRVAAAANAPFFDGKTKDFTGDKE